MEKKQSASAGTQLRQKTSGLMFPSSVASVHRIRNVLARVPKKKQGEVKKALHRIFYAVCLEDARDEAKHFLGQYTREFPAGDQTLARHLNECLTLYQFPERHWKHINTSNVIERAFKEVRKRTMVVGHFPSSTSALVRSLQSSRGREARVAGSQDESQGYRLDRGSIKGVGVRTNKA